MHLDLEYILSMAIILALPITVSTQTFHTSSSASAVIILAKIAISHPLPVLCHLKTC